MARHYKTFGLSCHIDNDADLITWLESLPSNARSAAIRDQLRYSLRAQGKLPTDYQRASNMGSSAPDMSDVKSMLRELMEMAQRGGFVLAERDASGTLQPSNLGFSDEARDTLTSRIFGDSDEDE